MIIDFPLKKEMAGLPMKDHEKNRMIMLEDLLLRKQEAVLTGFLNAPAGKKELDSIGDMKLKMLINNDESLVYEVAIPMNYLYQPTQNRFNKPLDLGLIINGFEMPQHKNGFPSNGEKGGAGPHGGMPPGGGMGGGMNGGRSGMHGGPGSGGQMPEGRPSFESMNKEVKMEVKVSLAKP